jgi:hypothetical protein
MLISSIFYIKKASASGLDPEAVHMKSAMPDCLLVSNTPATLVDVPIVSTIMYRRVFLY